MKELKLCREVLVVSFAVLSLSFCSTPKPKYFSYENVTGAIGIDTSLLYKNQFISFGNYLFEFKLREVKNTIVYGSKRPVVSVVYDTIGLFVLSGSDKQYYEFDGFSDNAKIIGSGPLENKPSGQKLSFKFNSSVSGTFFGIPRRTTHSGFPIFVSKIISSQEPLNDSLSQEVFLTKNYYFNSIYKVNGLNFSDSNYCIVGFRFFDKNLGEGLVQQIERINELTQNEEAICFAIVRLIKKNVF